MSSSKKLLCAILILSSLLFGSKVYAQENIPVQSILLEGSKLRINGTSNVNDFSCLYDEAFETDTLRHLIKVGEDLVEVGGDELDLKIDSFDCGKRGINRDFRNTLKSKEYPFIVVELISVQNENGIPSKADVNISLAGESKDYAVPLENISFDKGIFTVQGEQVLNMTDFNIDPPSALLGLIKVKDRLTIQFSLRIKQ